MGLFGFDLMSIEPNKVNHLGVFVINLLNKTSPNEKVHMNVNFQIKS